MKALDYANFCIKSKQVPKYVKKQAKEFIVIAKGKDDIYFVNELGNCLGNLNEQNIDLYLNRISLGGRSQGRGLYCFH